MSTILNKTSLIEKDVEEKPKNEVSKETKKPLLAKKKIGPGGLAASLSKFKK